MADRIYRTQAGPSGDVSMDLRDVRNVGLAGEDGNRALDMGGKDWVGAGGRWRGPWFR